jgi:hypothetical protein
MTIFEGNSNIAFIVVEEFSSFLVLNPLVSLAIPVLLVPIVVVIPRFSTILAEPFVGAHILKPHVSISIIVVIITILIIIK